MKENNGSTRNLLLRIWRHLSHSRRIQLGCLFLAMVASGAAELLSLGAVLPFLAVLIDVQGFLNQPLVQSLLAQLGVVSISEPALILTVVLVFAGAAVLAAAVRLLNLRLNSWLAASVGSDLSCEAYRRTLYQPYAVHVQRNTSSVITATSTQIDFTVLALFAFLQLITSGLVAIGLIIGLLFIDLVIALVLMLLFACAYGALVASMRKELYANGVRISVALNKQLKALQEGLGSIRDVLLDGSQATHLHIYKQADVPLRHLQAKNQYLGAFPRFTLEAFGMVVIALLGGILVLTRGSSAAVVPLLGALALGAQRLMPALQQMFNGWAVLKGYNSALIAVLEMLDQPILDSTNVTTPLEWRQQVQFQSVSYRYASDTPDVLNELTFSIRRGERIGLIGGTGSGKSSTADLFMGLLEPSQGKILVDGQNLQDPNRPELIKAWRANIAHVPQNIYLADTSIAENIAFGVPAHLIDMDRVRRAAAQAQIAPYIEAKDDGYDSFVGERGIRLSGGQRQRIGIARALYKEADVLVLDEATSALDSETESNVMDALYNSKTELTLVIIAHRLSTVAYCDRVFELSKGAILREMTGSQAARRNNWPIS